MISGSGIEIVPDILPVDRNRAYFNAKHKLFMSATLADDSVLIRELDCGIEAARNPIVPIHNKGLGERMVLAPSLVDSSLNREWVMGICRRLSKKVNVVVLSPSECKAREWESAGAKVVMRDTVSEVVNELKNIRNGGNFVVLVQRYDGIDLPDHSCRILVLDGMPYGEGIIDKHDSSLSAVPGGMRNRLIYRIEQGMGRAVRSHADYAVVILVDPGLAHFIAKHDVLNIMNLETQAQLRLALELSQIVKEESEPDFGRVIIDMIIKCLNRDEDWKQFYNEKIRSIDRNTKSHTNYSHLNLAFAERLAFASAMGNDLDKSISILRTAISNNIKNDNMSKGWYLQKVANYLYEINPGESLEVQRSAYEWNHSVICPPTIIKKAKKLLQKYNVQISVLKWFKQFENPNGAIAKITELKSRLSYDLSHNIIEQSICDLAFPLGADGSRPEREYNEGPDDLWLWPDISLVIEAKNDNVNSLHKKDSGQLLTSIEWFKRTYGTRKDPIPIVISKINVCDKDAMFPHNTRIITQNNMNELLKALELFYNRLIVEPLFASKPESVYEVQHQFNLTPNQILSNFTSTIKSSK